MNWLHDDTRHAMFASADENSPVWVGDLTLCGSGHEAVPFCFSRTKYVVMFVCPHHAADHDMAFLHQQLDTLSVVGFVPSPRSRLIKLFRAEAREKHFSPDHWRLTTPSQVFQFGRTLAKAVSVFVRAMPGIDQLMFLPASEGLSQMYRRVARDVARRSATSFISILPKEGVLYVFQKTPDESGHRAIEGGVGEAVLRRAA